MVDSIHIQVGYRGEFIDQSFVEKKDIERFYSDEGEIVVPEKILNSADEMLFQIAGIGFEVCDYIKVIECSGDQEATFYCVNISEEFKNYRWEKEIKND